MPEPEPEPSVPEPSIPKPFPVVSGTYSGVVTYREPTGGFSVRGNALIAVSQTGDRLRVSPPPRES